MTNRCQSIFQGFNLGETHIVLLGRISTTLSPWAKEEFAKSDRSGVEGPRASILRLRHLRDFCATGPADIFLNRDIRRENSPPGRGAVSGQGILRLRNRFAAGKPVALLRMTITKKAGTRIGPGIVLAGCPDKLEALSRRERAALSGE
ncbi:MAG: hypothetical protein DMG79_22215 [Acidobacteria bacterium]|nr:MAG: hypothetical protein DMG79_22215 [Acidobacteriota bacterium]